jgi:hypothetical protein
MDIENIEEFIVIDKRIDTDEDDAAEKLRDSIRARWDFGRLMLGQRKGKKLPDGLLDELVQRTGKSRSELQFRMRFAERYSEDELCSGEHNWESWLQVKNSLPKEEPAKPRRQPRTAPKRENPIVADLINEMEDTGEDYACQDVVEEAAARGVEVSPSTVERKRAAVRAERDAAPILWDTVPDPAKEKIDRVVQQRERQLEAEFNQRVDEEVKARMESVWAVANKTYADARAVLDHRKGLFTRADYDLIRSCLHPDSRLSVTAEKLAQAFRVFNEATIQLLDEKDYPTKMAMPTLDELKKRRAARDARKAV